MTPEERFNFFLNTIIEKTINLISILTLENRIKFYFELITIFTKSRNDLIDELKYHKEIFRDYQLKQDRK